MAGMQHDHQRALGFFTESLKLWTEFGDIDRQAGVSLNLGLVAQNLGDLERAESQFEHAHDLYLRSGDRRGQANAVGSRARVARRRDHMRLALELFNRCVTLFRELGDDWGTANSLANLGHVFLALGDKHNSEEAFREALQMRRALGNILHVAESLEGLAAVMAGDRPRVAVRLLGAAEIMRDQSGAPVPADEESRYAQLMATVRSGLSATMFRAGWNAGRALSTSGAVDLALENRLPADDSEHDGSTSDDQPSDATTLPDYSRSDTMTGQLVALTERERDIARLIGRGYSNREIADNLVLSVKTVETHVKHIFVKLNVRNRAGVAAIASRDDAA
jgi:DNA-binding CsgD family transcriptional regulator